MSLISDRKLKVRVKGVLPKETSINERLLLTCFATLVFLRVNLGLNLSGSRFSKGSKRSMKVKIQRILFKLRHNFPLCSGFCEFQTGFCAWGVGSAVLMITSSAISLMGHVNVLRASGSGKFLFLPRRCSAIFSSETFLLCLLSSAV